jgi:hypothetical protein
MIDKTYWENSFGYIDWYIRLEKEILSLFSAKQEKSIRKEVVRFAAELLSKDKIELGNDGPNFDKSRKPIDTIVIHHTGGDIPDLNYLSALGLLRLYAVDYLGNLGVGYDIYGKPIWSGHFLKGKQVFFAYHWLITKSGRAVRLLEDKYIGWHAGKWNVNRRSIGIAFSGNYADKPPSNAQIRRAGKLIAEYYPHVKFQNIIRHSKISDTICPGKLFEIKWKKKLL